METVLVIAKSLRHFEFHAKKLFEENELFQSSFGRFKTKDGREFIYVFNEEQLKGIHHTIFWGPLPDWFDYQSLLKVRAAEYEWEYQT